MNISFTPSISLTHKSQNDHQERQWNKHHFPNEHVFDSNGGYSIDSITPCQHVNVEGLHLRIQKLVICHYSSRKNNQLTMRSQHVKPPSPKYPKTLPPAKRVCHFEIPKHHFFLIKKTGSTIHPSSWVPGSNGTHRSREDLQHLSRHLYAFLRDNVFRAARSFRAAVISSHSAWARVVRMKSSRQLY